MSEKGKIVTPVSDKLMTLANREKGATAEEIQAMRISAMIDNLLLVVSSFGEEIWYHQNKENKFKTVIVDVALPADVAELMGFIAEVHSRDKSGMTAGDFEKVVFSSLIFRGLTQWVHENYGGKDVDSVNSMHKDLYLAQKIADEYEGETNES